MQVTLRYFAGCPNWRAAGQRLRQALDEIYPTPAGLAGVPEASDLVAAIAKRVTS